MLGWSAQTTVIALVLAAVAILASRSKQLGPSARHMLWLVVLIKLLTPPVLNWPWSAPTLWSPAASQPAVTEAAPAPATTAPRTITPAIVDDEELIAAADEDRIETSKEVPA